MHRAYYADTSEGPEGVHLIEVSLYSSILMYNYEILIHIYRSWYRYLKPDIYTHFFYKNIFYKNIKSTEICEILRIFWE